MLLVVITFLLVAVGVVSYIYGAWKLSRYASRISGGLGMGVLLFPPMTFHFAFFKLEQDGKEFPITMWLFGLVSTILLVIVFWTPISLVLTGRMDQLEKPTGVAETAVAEYGMKETDSAASDDDKDKAEPQPEPEEEPEPAATNNATTGTNGATGSTTAGTNNAAAGTNNATAGTNASP